jgi:hypothetical protein
MNVTRHLTVTLARLHNYSNGTMKIEVIPFTRDRVLVVLEARVCGQHMWTTYPIASVDPDLCALLRWLEAREEQASRLALSLRGLVHLFRNATKGARS